MPAAATTKNTTKSPLEKLSEETGLHLSFTTELVKDVATDILLTMMANTLGDSPKANKDRAMVQKALKELWPDGMFMDDKVSPTPYLLLGIPGHGKTTVYREAGKLVCQLTGKTFLDNPDSDTPVNEDSFVFMSVEFAGQTSTFSYKGIPIERRDKKEDGTPDDEAYMDYLKERLFTKMRHAAGGIMLLDDIGNATSSLMNAALPMMAERRYNRTDMKKMYIGSTGNLGSLDGTKISGYSSALLGRAKVVLVRDSAKDLAQRIHEKYGNDRIGDCFFSTFLVRQGQDFIEQIPAPGQLTPVPSPRSLEHACQSTRVELMKVGGAAHGQSALEPHRFHRNVGSLIGQKAGQDLASYLNAAYEHADPAARLLIDENKEHPAVEEHTKTPNELKSMQFFEQYGSALADYASLRLKEKGHANFDETVNRYLTGMYQLTGSTLTSSLSLFKDRLVYGHPDLSQAQGNSGKRVLTQDAYGRLLKLFSKHPDANSEDWGDITSVLSEAGLHDIAVTPVNNAGSAAPRARAPGAPVAPATPANKKKTGAPGAGP
jgi:hypothetical protein